MDGSGGIPEGATPRVSVGVPPTGHGSRKLRVFLNYRREDTADAAGRLFDMLDTRFPGRIFMDIDTIDPGADFVEVLEESVGSCDVLLALIGREWLTITDESGHRRLEDPIDYVRQEIQAALDRSIRVIPILVQGARMPGTTDLPQSIARLSRRNALEISSSRWHYDVGRLVDVLARLGVELAGDLAMASPAEAGPSSEEAWMEGDEVPAGPGKGRPGPAEVAVVAPPDRTGGTKAAGPPRRRRRVLAAAALAAVLVAGGVTAVALHRSTADFGILVASSAEGSPRLVSAGSGAMFPAWSPDGTRMAFVDQTPSGYRLDVMEADGGHQRTLLPPSLHPIKFDWSPQGSEIAYSEGGEGINAVDVDTGKTRLIVASKGVGSLTWSCFPTARGCMVGDHSEIAYRQEGALWVVRSDGSNPRVLFKGATSGLRWSPDGTRIAYVNASQKGGSVLSVLSVPAEGTGGAPSSSTLSVTGPMAWSPNGRQIAVVSKVDDNFDLLTVLVQSDGELGAPVDLTTTWRARHIVLQPSWSFNGDQLVFSAGVGDPPSYGLWVMTATPGATRTQITKVSLEGVPCRPVWQPVTSSTTIAFDLLPTATAVTAAATGAPASRPPSASTSASAASALVSLCGVDLMP
jgi:Tol biopolymer transport system component